MILEPDRPRRHVTLGALGSFRALRPPDPKGVAPVKWVSIRTLEALPKNSGVLYRRMLEGFLEQNQQTPKNHKIGPALISYDVV